MVDRRAGLRQDTPEYALACWKHTVGLPENFPRLNPLTDQELDPESKLYIGPMHEEVVEEIFDKVSGPSNVMFVKPGHGCTTLFRYVFNSLQQECVRRRLIPVRLAIEDKPPLDTLDYDFIESEALRELHEKFLSNRWRKIIGAKSYESLITSLLSFSTEVIAREQIDDIFNQISQTGLRVSLQVDLSSPLAYQNEDLYLQQLRNFGKAVRGFCNRVPSQPLLVSEMYFASREAWRIFNSERQLEAADETEYPPYNAVDIFAILSRHYIPIRNPSLACVIDSQLLSPYVSEDRPLVEIIRDFEQEILRRVGSPGESYQLK